MTTILVIEDESAIRANIVEILNYENYSTIEAENGMIGKQLAMEKLPDLIVCDIMMPDLNGFDVLQGLQSEQRTATIPFMFLTAVADRKSIRYGMELGADDYLTKPFTPDELIGAIRIRLKKHADKNEGFKNLPEPDPSLLKTSTLSSKSSARSRTRVGQTIRGYQIWELIGEGGVGIVYKAYQPSIGREVAIKVLQRKFADNIEFVRRFQTEAELVARLEHPHIIPLYDYWHDSKGVYIVMRWLRGGSLRTLLKQNGQLTIAQTIGLLDQIANALAIAHSVGIIHRDIKPDNILLDEYGNAYLSDFGLAKNLLAGTMTEKLEQNLQALIQRQKEFFEVSPNSTLYITDYEGMLGTPAYLSPEQIQFEPVSIKSDIYSLGITLYEMLAGTRPFTGDIGDLIIQHMFENLPPIQDYQPNLPKSAEAVIQRATAKDPLDRYDHVLSFANDFRKACEQG